MIFGIGTDIVEIKRIETMTSLDKFASKILSQNEKEFYEDLRHERHDKHAGLTRELTKE